MLARAHARPNPLPASHSLYLPLQKPWSGLRKNLQGEKSPYIEIQPFYLVLFDPPLRVPGGVSAQAAHEGQGCRPLGIAGLWPSHRQAKDIFDSVHPQADDAFRSAAGGTLRTPGEQTARTHASGVAAIVVAAGA